LPTFTTRRRAWLIIFAGLFATLALSFAVPQFANANVGPPEYTGCRPDEPACNPYSPPPTQYQAVGRDPDEAKAQKEAEQDASTFCGARGYKKVKVLISSAGNNTVYTLIYTCG
jgi:hypothetical protein